MAQTPKEDQSKGEKVNVTVQKRMDTKSQDGNKDQETKETDQVSKQAATIQPRREYLDTRKQEEPTDSKEEPEERQTLTHTPSSTSPAQRAAAKLKPSEDMASGQDDDKEESPSSGANGVDEYGQQPLTVADYAQQSPQQFAHEEERDYKLNKRQLKRPPKGHRLTPAVFLSALLLLILCGAVAFGVYFISQRSL